MIQVTISELRILVIGVQLALGRDMHHHFASDQADMISSVGVIVASVVTWTTGWYYADPLIYVGIGLFILLRTWALLRAAVAVLLEGTP